MHIFPILSIQPKIFKKFPLHCIPPNFVRRQPWHMANYICKKFTPKAYYPLARVRPLYTDKQTDGQTTAGAIDAYSIAVVRQKNAHKGYS